MRVRRRPEVDDDLRVARRQALAGAQVERHAGPAPVLHLGAQRDEGLGRAARAAPWLRRGSPAPACRRRCRRGTGRAPRRAPRSRRVKGLSERSTFSFSSRIASASLRRRRLHRDHRQQLQRVVLHHVAQRAGAVVEVAARAHAQRFGERDLDVGDALAPPQRLEQGVAEAQRRSGSAPPACRGSGRCGRPASSLNDRAHDAVDLLRAGQVVAERLFQHHAHVRRRSVRPRRAARRSPGTGAGWWRGTAPRVVGAARSSQPVLRAARSRSGCDRSMRR